MANYSSGNFLRDPASGDTLMYVYNSSSVLSMIIDPYSSVFEKSGSWIFIITDGQISYTNSLDFASTTEADSALARLNEVKRIILGWLNTTLDNYYNKQEDLIPYSGGTYTIGNSAYTFNAVFDSIEIYQQSESCFIMKDAYSGSRYKIILSGGTLVPVAL